MSRNLPELTTKASLPWNITTHFIIRTLTHRIWFPGLTIWLESDLVKKKLDKQIPRNCMSRPYANIFRQQNHYNSLSQRTQHWLTQHCWGYKGALWFIIVTLAPISFCVNSQNTEMCCHTRQGKHLNRYRESIKDIKKCSLWGKGLECLIQRKWKVKEDYKVRRENFLPSFKTPLPSHCKEMGFFDHHSVLNLVVQN